MKKESNKKLSAAATPAASDVSYSSLRACVDKWFAVATSTEPVDKDAAVTAVGALYKQAGYGYPKIEWRDSPLEGFLAHGFGSVAGTAGMLWGQEVSRAMVEVSEKVDKDRRAQVKDAFARVEHVTVNSVQAVACEMKNRTADRVNAVRTVLDATNLGNRFGSGDSLIMGFLDYYRTQLKPKRTSKSALDRLGPLIDITKNCGWWWPCKDSVILTERPTKLSLDDNHLLHSFNSTAIEYSDGFSACVWHGTRVPHDLILTPDVPWDALEKMIETNKKDETLRKTVAEIKTDKWLMNRWQQGDRRNATDLREAATAIFRIGGLKGLAAFMDGYE